MKLGNARTGVVVAIAVAILVPMLHARHRADAQTPVPPAVQPPAPSGAQPVDVLKLGRLTLKPCALKVPGSAVTTAAYCAPFEVPENRADPHARRIGLKLAIVKSEAQVAASDLVVYLAGGPGEAATQSYAQIAPAFAPLRKHHNILLLDQRGTGDSHPLDCPQAAKAIQASAEQPFDVQRMRAQTVQCLAEVRKTADPRYYTTTDAVADLEAVRQALGAPKLDLIGISYGTRMAQQYAHAHPESVRSIVLDGVVPNPLILGAEFATDLERALKLQSQACMAAPRCKAAFGDPYAALHALHDKLRAQPAQAMFPDPKSFKTTNKPVTADTLAGVARMFSYNAETAALLPLTVAQASHGNYTPLMGQAQILAGSLDSAMNAGMQLSVICAEDADLLHPNAADAGTLLGGEMVDGIKAECAVWPHGARPADFHAPFESSIPTLLLSGERDPVTPPRYADEVLKGLSDARSLVASGMGHSILMRGCVPKLVDDFVTGLQPKKLDAACVKQIGPVPAFVDFNGAAP
jgi:pimeloyl-ACP methyl ester carboxylesterase